MVKRQRSSSLSEPFLDASRRRVLINSDEGMIFKPCIQGIFSAVDIRSAVQAPFGRYSASLAENQ
jgi:hypothetical protein